MALGQFSNDDNLVQFGPSFRPVNYLRISEVANEKANGRVETPKHLIPPT
jgi:hypothetical protein